MKSNKQGNERRLLKDEEKEERAERVARARERLKSGYYSSPDIISFLAERIIIATK